MLVYNKWIRDLYVILRQYSFYKIDSCFFMEAGESLLTRMKHKKQAKNKIENLYFYPWLESNKCLDLTKQACSVAIGGASFEPITETIMF